MKIIELGRVPNANTKEVWYRGKLFSCPHCHCKFENEAGDTVQFEEGRFSVGAVGMDCPTCGCTAWVYPENEDEANGKS